ncbi:hypothetical protein ABM34_09050 [Companilactobacillus ginsenosidimutans]|uniref:Uncharacterized protein n=1 Tax=Companilactobacillus ginsenosidimutans TaxID=1007676 RepID=A0A0H4QGX1_9LACO|nr:hypothetical protein ABM34_09050 [Companilactobacillus ginsenosidimutans]
MRCIDQIGNYFYFLSVFRVDLRVWSKASVCFGCFVEWVHCLPAVRFRGGRGRCEHDFELFEVHENLKTRFFTKLALWQAKENATAWAPAEPALRAISGQYIFFLCGVAAHFSFVEYYFISLIFFVLTSHLSLNEVQET